MIRDRLPGFEHAFDHPVTLWIVAGIAGTLLVATAVIAGLSLAGLVKAETRTELWRRTLSWMVMAPLIVAPILLGRGWTIGFVTLACLACYAEYARATGLLRERSVSVVVVLGILAAGFAAFDHWYGFFAALVPLTVGLIAVTAVLRDEPTGYIRRTALGVFGFMLFGCALQHLGFMANDANYRPLLLTLLVAVQMNDVFAYGVGRSIGLAKLAPNTSPNKTLEGSIGAMLLTIPLTALLGHHLFRQTALDRPDLLLLLGAIVSVLGQLGDLTISSIKRDLGIKDMAATIPGHGGVLDRVNSLLFTTPAVFHFVNYCVGIGVDQPKRILSGG
ncbi:MAG: phosphatidate cytidylyltransferase [Planctomycetes bacterium]|nr:phosphatidate cytidylyltransferase [Planctomycetota bacterium]